MHGNTGRRLKGSRVATRWLYRMVRWPLRSGVADPRKPSVSKMMKEGLSSSFLGVVTTCKSFDFVCGRIRARFACA